MLGAGPAPTRARPAPRRRAAGALAAAAKDAVTLRFRVPYRCDFGQHLRVVGDGPALGEWDLAAAPAMAWSEGDVWVAELRVPAHTDPRTLEYKYVVVGEGGAECATWKPGGNYSLAMPPAGGGLVQVRDAWDEASREVLVEVERAARARRRRRKAGGGGAGSEEEEEAEAIASAAARALGQLEATVALSEGLMAGAGGDPGAAELVAADRMLAAAAARAAALARACDAATDSRALPPPA